MIKDVDVEIRMRKWKEKNVKRWKMRLNKIKKKELDERELQVKDGVNKN